MAHRAAVYMVRVKRSRKQKDKHRLLGNIDDAGTYLGDRLVAYLSDPDFTAPSEDGSKLVRCASAARDGEDVEAIMLQGQNGVVADLFDEKNQPKAHQVATDTHQIRCGVLFRLPPAQEIGWLAVHSNYGRSAKGLMTVALNKAFREDFPDLAIEIAPYVDEAALMKAVEQDRLNKVKLVRYEEPDDRAAAATDKWVEADAIGRLELTISAPEHAKRLMSGLVSKFFRDRSSENFNSIVVFENIRFDEAKVEVQLPNGDQRTFNIEKPESGHAFSEDLSGLSYDDEGEPTEASLFSALATILGRVSS